MFAFRLAALLGWDSVESGLARMSSREFTEWMIVMRNGWIDWADEYRAALIASVVANTARDEKRKREPFQPADFMRREYLPKPSPEQLQRKIQRVFAPLVEVKHDNAG
ncbi:MAG: hypothetical protein KatS3mg054_0661 [Chloroflexus sp.]|nr:MAG: hypothetical protein KatS3mg054_0661 [Chloroflexus sp.]